MPPKSPVPLRFRDDRTFLSDFADDILVVCPRCAQCASITPAPDPQRVTAGQSHRLVCASCGLTREIQQGGLPAHANINQIFGYPLYLSIRCAGNLLWAYNYRHLAWLKRYVQATLRETRRDPKWGWSNASAASRLPGWIKSAKNRRAVLRSIEKIEKRAGGRS